MQSKISRVIELSATALGPVLLDSNVSAHESYAIQVNYNAGGAGNLSLLASLDGINFCELPSTIQAVDVAGGSHIWNISNSHYQYIRVSIPAVTITRAMLVGSRLEQKA